MTPGKIKQLRDLVSKTGIHKDDLPAFWRTVKDLLPGVLDEVTKLKTDKEKLSAIIVRGANMHKQSTAKIEKLRKVLTEITEGCVAPKWCNTIKARAKGVLGETK